MTIDETIQIYPSIDSYINIDIPDTGSTTNEWELNTGNCLENVSESFVYGSNGKRERRIYSFHVKGIGCNIEITLKNDSSKKYTFKVAKIINLGP